MPSCNKCLGTGELAGTKRVFCDCLMGTAAAMEYEMYIMQDEQENEETLGSMDRF